MTKYVKEGIIEVEKLPNGRYEYFDEIVFESKEKTVEELTKKKHERRKPYV